MSIIEKAIAKLNESKVHNEEAIHHDVTLQKDSAQNKHLHEADSSGTQVTFNLETLSAAGIVSPNEHAPYLSDEFRRIKRPLLNNAFGSSSELVQNGNVIMITSSLPGEGKSFSSVNLALSIALEKDFTVLLVDADMAMSKITRMFALENRPGLTDKLENPDLELNKLTINTDFPGLSVIPSGKKTAMATELLASNAMKALIDQIANENKSRIIIFDSPPLLATPESAVLAEQMGQIVLVVESNKTPQSAVMESIGLLDKDKAISLVLNKASRNFGHSQYGNYYAYGQSKN